MYMCVYTFRIQYACVCLAHENPCHVVQALQHILRSDSEVLKCIFQKEKTS